MSRTSSCCGAPGDDLVRAGLRVAPGISDTARGSCKNLSAAGGPLGM